MSSDDEARYADERDGWNPKGGRLSSSDDGQTIAVPLTQAQARKMLRDNMWYAEADWHPESGRDLHVDLLAAVLSASPEVLAAALGGEYRQRFKEGMQYIVLPPREKS